MRSKRGKVTPLWISREQAIEEWGISARTLSNWVQKGIAERRRTGRKCVYKMANKETKHVANVANIAIVPKLPKLGQPTTEVLISRIEEQAVRIANLETQLKELQEDHTNLWDVVGDLTTEAIELERQLQSFRSI